MAGTWQAPRVAKVFLIVAEGHAPLVPGLRVRPTFPHILHISVLAENAASATRACRLRVNTHCALCGAVESGFASTLARNDDTMPG